MSKHKKITTKVKPRKPLGRPKIFRTFLECVSWLKKSVYIVVRGREIENDGTKGIRWVTLGSGFLAAPNRFLTASHVISDPQKDDFFQHKDGDKYYLLKHDDEDNLHSAIIEPKLDSELFTYQDIDLAIIYLTDNFYQDGNTIFANKNDFIRVSKDFLPIGSMVGVLGYPLCQLGFNNREITKPLIGDIILRVDKGVINCRYKTSETNYLYEFTLAFNPGNSGGPIFNIKTGELISIVKGYKAIRINHHENLITEEGRKQLQLKHYKEESFISTVDATYSYGFATPTFLEVLKKHKIIN